MSLLGPFLEALAGANISSKASCASFGVMDSEQFGLISFNSNEKIFLGSSALMQLIFTNLKWFEPSLEVLLFLQISSTSAVFPVPGYPEMYREPLPLLLFLETWVSQNVWIVRLSSCLPTISEVVHLLNIFFASCRSAEGVLGVFELSDWAVDFLVGVFKSSNLCLLEVGVLMFSNDYFEF